MAGQRQVNVNAVDQSVVQSWASKLNKFGPGQISPQRLDKIAPNLGNRLRIAKAFEKRISEVFPTRFWCGKYFGPFSRHFKDGFGLGKAQWEHPKDPPQLHHGCGSSHQGEISRKVENEPRRHSFLGSLALGRQKYYLFGRILGIFLRANRSIKCHEILAANSAFKKESIAHFSMILQADLGKFGQF